MSPTIPNRICQRRSEKFRNRCWPLPGSTPYENRRPMAVGGRFDGWRLGEFLAERHPHVELENWLERIRDGRFEIDGRIVSNIDQKLRSGNRIVQIIPHTVEPEVSVEVRFLFEDEDLVVLHKPAPLPVHPCGRYHHNSLVRLLRHSFGEEGFRPVHRLDADTTGLLILAKTRGAARALTGQFERRAVKKTYLAEVQGHPKTTSFSCDAAISDRPSGRGKRRIEAQGNDASTSFEVLESKAQSSILSVYPRSGRTNQIRVHLASVGHPIVGDESYANAGALISGRSALHLCAWKLEFQHPIDDVWMQFEDERPKWAGTAPVYPGRIEPDISNR